MLKAQQIFLRLVNSESPCVPALVPLSSEEFNLTLLWKHFLDSFTHSIRFFRVACPFNLDELPHISCPSRLRNFTTPENKAQLTLTHGIGTRVQAFLIPDKSDRRPLKTPCFAKLNRLIQMWRRTPHKKQTILFTNGGNIPCLHF